MPSVPQVLPIDQKKKMIEIQAKNEVEVEMIAFKK